MFMLGIGMFYAVGYWNTILTGGLFPMKGSPQLSPRDLSRIRKVQSQFQLIQKNDFKDEVCGVYDLMIGTGMEPCEAIRKTRSALKAINYPHATYDVVIANLRASGRLRKHMHEKIRETANE
jgi:hypothetical protein